MKFEELCQTLETAIQSSYDEGVTLEQAERLAARFLYGQLKVSDKLKAADLDARMRKSGVKAIRATIYQETVSGVEKKPTEAMIGSTIDTNETVAAQQDALDTAEADKAHLDRLFDVFGNAHVYFRTIAKGRFE